MAVANQQTWTIPPGHAKLTIDLAGWPTGVAGLGTSGLEQLALLEYILGLIVGFVAVSLLLFYSGMVGRRDARLLAGAILVQNLRVMIFAFSYYSPLLELGIFPDVASLHNLATFLYYCLVALHGGLLVAWLFRRAGWKGLPAALLPYSLYYLVTLLVMAAPVFRLALPAPLDNLRLVQSAFVLGGVLLDKACIMATVVIFLVRRSRLRTAGSAHERAALVALGLAVLADSILPWLPLSLLAIFATMLPFYAVPFLVMAGMRRETQAAALAASQGTTGATQPPRLASTPPGSDAATLACRLGLDEAEARLVAAILGGRSNKEIAWAEQLGLSAVKHRLFALYRRLGVASRFELIALVNRSFSQAP
ncbi:MAG: hypothetical protein A2087_06155 [Spirochaetes bacterium GWD1_61_31]|nr:MAG: hypothetical protein A2087_06155 [Spirochaetes bacterium GWD1_61_31]OHD44702.1 MAG: hypothetical protein A2Y35_01130 [Spirochaetes bacterium GWE1_60_18]HAW86901.1 hypothetical protein [Spirochaetaceae bacterium]HAX37164.1 hypothetical protein [Spirochaetaceae bacterium]